MQNVLLKTYVLVAQDLKESVVHPECLVQQVIPVQRVPQEILVIQVILVKEDLLDLLEM
jgi:hypothetical protein